MRARAEDTCSHIKAQVFFNSETSMGCPVSIASWRTLSPHSHFWAPRIFPSFSSFEVVRARDDNIIVCAPSSSPPLTPAPPLSARSKTPTAAPSPMITYSTFTYLPRHGFRILCFSIGSRIGFCILYRISYRVSVQNTVNHCGMHSVIRSGFLPHTNARHATCGNTSTKHRVDAAVIHYLWESPLGTEAGRVKKRRHGTIRAPFLPTGCSYSLAPQR